ncbi:tetratricopeptide repeat protein [Enterovirga aerilata]|uniref:Tetratricopeptide repeat protein n=1 Tax=Enterovirga aerilata TaxID=2730920 RepID=A0A849I2Q4_9HYPH|nr:tetratricopeptide repeat protein [Enterovirga sp. DB1703]NNM71638.1 tetratricopeptide repeat protein [Enterovirga sp. DB1703]
MRPSTQPGEADGTLVSSVSMMPYLGRRSGPALGRLLLLLCFALGAGVVGAGSAAAREVTVTGTKMDRFGRILLHFDQPTKVSARVANAVLIITFAEPSRIKAEKLATELAPYITTVRRDPDGTGLRIALAAPVRPNMLEAAERVFIDLLPPNWTGLPPGLPPEVVAELARRVQEAEAKLRAAAPRRTEPARTVKLRMAELPSLTRLVFETPPALPVQIREVGEGVELAFEGASAFDGGGAKPKLAAGVAAFEAERDGGVLMVRVRRAPGFAAQTFREPDGIVVDLAKPQPPQVLPEPAPAREAAAPPPSAVSVVPPQKVEAEPAAPPAPPPAPDHRLPTAAAVAPPPAGPPATVLAKVETGPQGASLLFPFRSRTPAAAFVRAGALTIVFDAADRLDVSALANSPDPSLRPMEVRQEPGLVTLRFPEPAAGSARFSAEGEGWRLSAGSSAALPADSLKVTRALDEHGRPLVRVGLLGSSRAHWLREPDGMRLAVVTASGRAQTLPLARSFVEFGLAPTLHGVVVEAHADDVAVALGQTGVSIGRELGLSLSLSPRGQEEGGTASRLVLKRDAWVADVAPGAFDRYAALVWEAAHASRAGRAEARYRLARFLVANGLDHEASSVLALARAEDPVFARRRETVLLSGIAAARARRFAEARAFLAAAGTSEEPEAILWRAAVDAMEGRWAAALAGFRRANEVVELYPDDLAGPIRLLALNAALEEGDIARAEGELGAIDRMATGSVPRDRHDLARARVDAAAGREEAALKDYERLIAEADLPVRSEATLHWTRLGLKTKTLELDDAIERLETLSVTWRGDELELAAITDLARHYGEAKRWRDMFAMARRANRYFPKHPATRALQEDSARLLEELLLRAEDGKLSGVQALALYFDFKELAPVGRRGDEIVRRLADRLVELDLLDQAADLLQYQVEKRLTGAARATVAARLAAIRLMSGKPLLALAALHATRLAELPEEVRRFRYVLEARAQAELSRPDLALEILEGETGPDFDRLRTSILWTARRWREAGEAGEAMLGTRWEGAEPLTDRERADVLRAAIAYALADERISLDRLRQKFGRKMLDSPDAKTFGQVVSPDAVQTREFRLAAQEATRADSLRLLLSDWRGRPLEHPAEPESDAPPSEPPTVPRVEGAVEGTNGAPARG